MKTLGCLSAVAMATGLFMYLMLPPHVSGEQVSAGWKAPPWSMFREATYEAPVRLLRLRFASGREYVYVGVPQDCFAAFMRSESKGAFFHKYIRRHYPTQRLEDAESRD